MLCVFQSHSLTYEQAHVASGLLTLVSSYKTIYNIFLINYLKIP